MSDPSARTFSSDFRRFFLRGLVVLMPSVLTLWIVFAAYQFIDHRIAEPINRGVRVAMNNTARYWEPLAESFNPPRAQLEAEVAERVLARGVVTRRQVREELRAAGVAEPTDEEVNAYITALPPDRRRGVNIEVVRAEIRQRAIDEWWAARWYMNLIGLVIAIVGVYIVGRVLGGYFGRQIYRRLEDVITSLPVFKQVYPYVKQIVDFLFSDEKQMKFSRVVATEYPRKGIWSIGFQTGPPLSSVAEHAGDSVTIFIPSSPTPFTGYTITVPRSEVIEVPITVEEAIRFAVSGGVLVPDHQSLIDAKGAMEAAAAKAIGNALPAAGMSETHAPKAREKAAEPRRKKSRRRNRKGAVAAKSSIGGSSTGRSSESSGGRSGNASGSPGGSSGGSGD